MLAIEPRARRPSTEVAFEVGTVRDHEWLATSPLFKGPRMATVETEPALEFLEQRVSNNEQLC